MKPDLYIARRYLVARKSLGVIHAISVISAIGMAVGTAALIIILSVYNGFDKIIKQSLSDLAPDVLVTPAQGKYFVPEGPAFEALLADARVAQAYSVVEEQVFATYAGRQELARAKGVDAAYEADSRLADYVVEGKFALRDGDVPQAAVGVAFARKLGLRTRFLDPLVLYYPRRGARVALAGPGAALGSVKLAPAALLSVNATADEELVLVPIAQMRSLLGLADNEVSGLELRLTAAPDRRTLRSFQELLGPDYVVRDRIRQQPALYKMMRYEKLAIYMILIFIVIIIAFNIYSSLTMLIIEKKDDIGTLRSLGAPEPMTRRIFLLEGWLISLLGLAIGLVLGIAFVLLQQKYGLIRMPGSYIISAYPVILKTSDILWTVVGVALVGYLIALLPSLTKTTDNQ